MSTGFFGVLHRGPASYEPNSPWGPWLASVATVVIFIVAASLSLALCEVILDLLGAGSLVGSLKSGRVDGAVKNYSLSWTIVMQAILVALTLMAARFFGGRPMDVLALRAPKRGWGVLVPAFLALVVITGIYSALAYLVWPDHVFTDLRPFYEMILGGSGLLLGVAAVVGAPFSEELLFRGFLLPALARSRLGLVGGVLLSNVAWTALHAQYSLVGLGGVFLVGLVQSWLLWRTGSIWVPIICHALYNALVLLTIVWTSSAIA